MAEKAARVGMAIRSCARFRSASGIDESFGTLVKSALVDKKAG